MGGNPSPAVVSFGGPGIHQLWHWLSSAEESKDCTKNSHCHDAPPVSIPLRSGPHRGSHWLLQSGCFKSVSSPWFLQNPTILRNPQIGCFKEIPSRRIGDNQMVYVTQTSSVDHPTDRNCLILVNVFVPNVGGSSHLVYIPGKWE